MLFVIFVVLLVAGIILIWLKDYVNELCAIIFAFGFLGTAASLIIIGFAYIGADARIEANNVRYETLTYQLENNIYDNDNDLGKRDLMEDIQEWNEDVTFKQNIQDNFWVGIYYPNIYDQFETIPLDLGGEKGDSNDPIGN